MNPDDICAVCETKRDEHGDKEHEFNLDGILIPKKKPEPARQAAPRERGEAPPLKPAGVEEMEKSHLRLIEVLVEKGVLNGFDVVKILGGPSS